MLSVSLCGMARACLGSMGLLGLGALAGCGAVYPEVATPVRVPGARTLSPPPPDDIVYLKFASALIPTRTRDGRQWDSVGGSAPDPFAKLLVDDKEVLVTPVQANTLSPTWPDQHAGNHRLPRNVPMRVELWDSNPINNHPICVESINNLLGEVSADENLSIRCQSGANIELTVQPAHAKFGIGLYYEFRTYDIFVTRVVGQSPAARAGVQRSDQLLKIQGRPVKELDADSARSLINSNVATGVTLTIQRSNGPAFDITLKDGPMYPTIEEELQVD
jgi:hypothetical protein